jgi:hypothetical protein
MLSNKEIAEVLKSRLEKAQKMWNEKSESHPYIIGYLEGAIKSAIEYLEYNEEEK